ncbi:unnamed protein product [Meganyctiphanes norvegica]|uniref:COMM domain-containing protein 3 n=1 Tax=Meganyctiphanes norvegica TaxID=48144 RepID=A0AAV2QYZ2_MEGNR
MELSQEVSSALRLAGNTKRVPAEKFQEIVELVIESLVIAEKSTEKSSANSNSLGELNCCHVALATLFAEAVRRSHPKSVVATTLEGLDWSEDRIDKAASKLESHRQQIRNQLAAIGTFPPHIVDIDWKLDYHVKSSSGARTIGAQYLITLYTEEGGGQRGEVTFTCSQSELTQLLTKLRQATRVMQKYASSQA